MEILWFGLIACAVFFVTFLFFRRMESTWKKAANHFGLTYIHGGMNGTPELIGEVQGVPVKVRVSRVSTGWAHRESFRSFFTELNAELASPWNCRVRITKRGFADKLGELIGGKDIKIGDEEFDREFRIRGHVSDEIGDVLLKGHVQSGLRRLASTFKELNVQHGAIRVRNDGRIANPNKLIRQITALVDVARELNAGIGASNAPTAPPMGTEQIEDDPFPELCGAPDDGSRDVAETIAKSDTEPIW